MVAMKMAVKPPFRNLKHPNRESSDEIDLRKNGVPVRRRALPG
jgi:hypothetical protein